MKAKEQERPDAFVVMKKGTDNLHSASHMFFAYQTNVREWCEKNLSDGWKIRPAKLVFLDKEEQ